MQALRLIVGTPTLRLIVGTPTLRLIAVAMLLIGAINASIFPYQSLVAIDRIGLAPQTFALLLVVASVVGVAAAVAAGIVTDQRANRRFVALLTAATAIAGPAFMLLAPGPVSLMVCHAVLLPISGSLFGQCFALARLATSDMPAARDGVLATLRAGLSLTFLAVLAIWSLAFGAGLGVMAIYGLATLAALLLFAVTLRDWPRDGRTGWSDPPSGLSLRQSLREMAVPRVVVRLVFLGAINSAPTLYMVLISLVFSEGVGRDASDVALFAGLVAGFEVPFMLLIPLIAHRLPRSILIALGAVVYAAYLALLPVLVATPFLWLLPALAGLGGAVIFTLSIAYLQDLMADRPGTGSALMAVQKVTGDVFSAAAFAVGTITGGYGVAAALGAAIALGGAAGLVRADRRAAISAS